MAKYIQLKIETPCNQPWEHMQKSSEGRFCNACQKTVVDFTGMTDSQLLAYFKNPSANECGRFYTDQLDRPISVPPGKVPWLRYFFQVSIPALLLNYKASAQGLVKKNSPPMEVIITKPGHPTALSMPCIISGRIINTFNEGIPYASIVVKETGEGIAADSNGLFTLQCNKPPVFIEVSAVGYQPQAISGIRFEKNTCLDISMVKNVDLSTVVISSSRKYSQGAMGRSRWTRYYSSKETKTAATGANMQVFPNPARKDGMITIRLGKPVDRDQQVNLYNAAGMKVLTLTADKYQLNEGFQLRLNVHSGGYYVLQVVDSKTKVRQVATLIIE